MNRLLNFRRAAASLLAALSLILLAGCNTVRGVGKDIERAGEVIQGRSAATVAVPAQPVVEP